ncbi:MAG: methyltransferase domain-containing protein [Armatimonadota bacterium]
MDRRFLAILRCPFCQGVFELRPRSPGPDSDVQTGLLECECSRFPIVYGIPVLKLQPEVAHVIALLERDRADEALQHLLDVGRNRSIFSTGITLRTAIRQLKLRGGNYFFHRFSDPSFVGSLALVPAISTADTPLLDLCCGVGHFSYTFAQRLGTHAVVGLELDFACLYLARRFLVPEGQFVCCDAGGGLPFADRLFASVFCSDAFHYVVAKHNVARDLLRVLDEQGVVLLTHLHNGLCRNFTAGRPLAPGGYRRLFSELSPRVYKDSWLLDAVLGKRALDLSQDSLPDDLANEPVIALSATRDEEFYKVYPPVDLTYRPDWLRVNPLYSMRTEKDQVILRVQFPSPEYEAEFGACRQYMPESIALPAALLQGLETGREDETVHELVERRVLLELPPRYY